MSTTLLDPDAAPAVELAALYHERWESEGIFAELKVTLPGARPMLRSRRVGLVEQELYGLLLVDLALRQLIYQASRRAGCDPDRLSFLHAVRVVRRHLPFHAAFSPGQRRRMRDLILIESIAVPAERSRGRHNPRVVKRKMSNFPTQTRAAPGPPPGRRVQYRDHVAPAAAETAPAMAAPRHRRACKARADGHAFWLEHVRAWRASGLARADSAERHGLNLRALHQWSAQWRHIFRRRAKVVALA